jgi:hypothetical protein
VGVCVEPSLGVGVATYGVYEGQVGSGGGLPAPGESQATAQRDTKATAARMQLLRRRCVLSVLKRPGIPTNLARREFRRKANKQLRHTGVCVRPGAPAWPGSTSSLQTLALSRGACPIYDYSVNDLRPDDQISVRDGFLAMRMFLYRYWEEGK